MVDELVAPAVEYPVSASLEMKTTIENPAAKWKSVKDKLIEKRNTGQMKLKHMVQFVSGIEELQKWVNILTVKVSNLSPIGLNAKEIQCQLEETEVNKLLYCMKSLCFTHLYS